MQNQETRNQILKKITASLQGAKVKMPFPEVEQQKQSVFLEAPEDATEIFASEFIKLGGKFIYCENEAEMVQQLIGLADTKSWQHVHCNEGYFINYFADYQLAFTKTGFKYHDMEAAITSCEMAIARLGSLLISSASDSGRILNVYCPIHICIVYANQIVWDIADATAAMQKKYGSHLPSMLNLATGPSRTADIEKTLVVGVHGPKEVYVMYIDKTAPYE
jgi:L-lactate dehydrogenase complex protein LldG